MHSVYKNLVIFPGVGAYDHLTGPMMRHLNSFFAWGGGEFEQKNSKNSNDRGGGDVEASL